MQRLYLTAVILKLLAHQLRHGMPRRYSNWRKWELEALVELYPWFTNQELVPIFGRGRAGIKTRAQKSALQLMKHPQTIDRIRREMLPATRATQFRPGRKPDTTAPVGTIIRDSLGYYKRKVRDDAPPGLSRRNWVFLHVELWERHHGPAPEGMKVAFRNSDKTDVRIDNLELISDAELMRRNTRHRYPEEINLAITAKAQLTRRINQLENRTA